MLFEALLGLSGGQNQGSCYLWANSGDLTARLHLIWTQLCITAKHSKHAETSKWEEPWVCQYQTIILMLLWTSFIFERARLAFQARFSMPCCSAPTGENQLSQTALPNLPCHSAREWYGGKFSTLASIIKTHILNSKKSVVLVNMPCNPFLPEDVKVDQTRGEVLCWCVRMIALNAKHGRLCGHVILTDVSTILTVLLVYRWHTGETAAWPTWSSLGACSLSKNQCLVFTGAMEAFGVA